MLLQLFIRASTPSSFITEAGRLIVIVRRFLVWSSPFVFCQASSSSAFAKRDVEAGSYFCKKCIGVTHTSDVSDAYSGQLIWNRNSILFATAAF
jgi:hypothetical protein